MIKVSYIIEETKKFIKNLTAWVKSKEGIKNLGGMFIVIISTAALFSYQAAHTPVADPSLLYKYQKGGFLGKQLINITGNITKELYVKEGESQKITINISEKGLSEITFALTWKDEKPEGIGSRLSENEPDTFTIAVSSPFGENKSVNGTNDANGNGAISVTFRITQDKPLGDNGTGEWLVEVTCNNAGDIYGRFLGIVLIDTDDGNSCTLSVTYTYQSVAEEK